MPELLLGKTKTQRVRCSHILNYIQQYFTFSNDLPTNQKVRSALHLGKRCYKNYIAILYEIKFIATEDAPTLNTPITHHFQKLKILPAGINYLNSPTNAEFLKISLASLMQPVSKISSETVAHKVNKTDRVLTWTNLGAPNNKGKWGHATRVLKKSIVQDTSLVVVPRLNSKMKIGNLLNK